MIQPLSFLARVLRPQAYYCTGQHCLSAGTAYHLESCLVLSLFCVRSGHRQFPPNFQALFEFYMAFAAEGMSAFQTCASCSLIWWSPTYALLYVVFHVLPRALGSVRRVWILTYTHRPSYNIPVHCGWLGLCGLSWLQSHHVAKNGPELLILFAFVSRVLGFQVCITMSGFCGSGG